MQACSWEYCNNVRTHFNTETLGWLEPNPPGLTNETFLISIPGNKSFDVNDVEFDFSMGCILVIFCDYINREREI